MKKILFLLLFPSLALAQYQGNANQKITLGEQTTADGLVYRGLAADTTRKPSVDTMAFILLDTNTNIIWQYKKATNNAWTRVGGSISSGVTGVLPVANGGTNTSTAFTAGSVVFAGASGTYTQDNGGLFYDNTNDRLGIGTASPSDKFTVSTAASGGNTQARFVSTDNTASTNFIVDVENSAAKRLQITGFGGSASGNFLGTTRAGNSFVVKAGGKLGVGVDDDYDLFLSAGYTSGVKTMTIEQNGGFKFSTLAGSGSRAVNADANGVITATSSILIKENVESINYGLNDVLKLKPVIFNYIDKNKWGEGKELGFIAEDVMNVIPESTGVMANSDIYFDLQKLIPVLTKAIQEQQALIKALEQRILNLENK